MLKSVTDKKIIKRKDLLVEAFYLIKSKLLFDDLINLEILLAFVLDIDEHAMLKNLNTFISKKKAQLFEFSIIELITGKPVEHIVKKKEFFGNIFFISSRVLIPRLDSETTVEISIKYLSKIKNPRIIDIGAGSCCISITLALFFPKLKAFAVDISLDAIKIAKKNINNYGLSDRIHLYEGNFSNPFVELSNVDLIVSNPPYVKRFIWQELHDKVKLFEPKEAIIGGCADGLCFHREILKKVSKIVNPRGIVVLETGFDQKKHLENSEFENFKLIQFANDLSGNNRCVVYKREG